MNNIYNFLGLAFRANKVITGESVLKGIRSKRVDLVIIASDASENTKKKYIDKCQFYHVDYLILEDSTHLSNAIGKANRMVFGITDRGFSRTLKDKVRRLTNG